MSKSSLPPAQTARLNALASSLLEQAEGDNLVATVTQRAMAAFPSQEAAVKLSLLPDAELEACGWTRSEINIAIHALASKNNQPAALAMSHERHIVRSRARQANGDESPEALGYVIPVAGRPALTGNKQRQLTAEDDD